MRSTAFARRSSTARMMRAREAETTSNSSPGFSPRLLTSVRGNRTPRLLPHLETTIALSRISALSGYPEWEDITRLPLSPPDLLAGPA